MTQKVFITGMARSGTTLLEKMLGSLEGFQSFSQPLPLLLVKLKADFLRQNGISGARLDYPLSDQQFENAFLSDEFTAFLVGKSLDESLIRPVLEQMENYSGQYFKPNSPLSSLANWQSGTLSSFVDRYFTTHASKIDAASAMLVWKEVLAESYIPYLLQSGFRCISIIRDPRDIYTSLAAADGVVHAGKTRPILWVAKQWRCSVAYLNQFKNKPNFKFVKYEDLVSEPDRYLDEFASWMGTACPSPLSQFTSSEGENWKGNSSFGEMDDVSTRSVGTYRDKLDISVQRSIEALCYAEMKYLGYETSLQFEDVGSVLETDLVDVPCERPEMKRYQYDERRKLEELQRWAGLTDPSAKFSRQHTIFEHNHQTLQTALLDK